MWPSLFTWIKSHHPSSNMPKNYKCSKSWAMCTTTQTTFKITLFLVPTSDSKLELNSAVNASYETVYFVGWYHPPRKHRPNRRNPCKSVNDISSGLIPAQCKAPVRAVMYLHKCVTGPQRHERREVGQQAGEKLQKMPSWKNLTITPNLAGQL